MQFELQERPSNSSQVPQQKPHSDNDLNQQSADNNSHNQSEEDLPVPGEVREDSYKSDMATGQGARGAEIDSYFSSDIIRDAPKPLHEESPLLLSGDDDDDDDEDERDDLINGHGFYGDDGQDEYQETKGLAYMILLTISIGGLQLAWSTELSNGTPYLLSLGISKSVMALVWIAGPLSGALVQPYVGIMSDNCRSSWGKRTPFMFFGSVATIASLLSLAWVREIIAGIFGLFGVDRATQAVHITTIIVAVTFVYVLDFSINTVQAGIRAFILDCCPAHQQESANAMASRIVGVGNILGYICGFVDLPKYAWFLGNTQFEILCAIASISLASTILISILSIRERDPRKEPAQPQGEGGLIAFFKSLFTSIRNLPPQTRKVCEVQFFAWIGFFPQLFYSSSYIGDIYVQPYLEANPDMTPAEIDKLYEQATRVGTFALLVYALTSLATNVLLPFFIAPSYDSHSAQASLNDTKETTRLSRFLDALIIPGLTLRRAWLIAHLIFAGCMFSTLWVRSINAATALIGLVGVPWALTLWAPFAIISAEVSKRDALRRSRELSGEDVPPEDQAGLILGIHNMAVAAPQILATVGSSIIFKILQKPRGTPGDRSISVVLASGGLFTLIAAFLTSRIQDEVPLPTEGMVEEAIPRRPGSQPRSSASLVRSASYHGLEY